MELHAIILEVLYMGQEALYVHRCVILVHLNLYLSSYRLAIEDILYLEGNYRVTAVIKEIRN